MKKILLAVLLLIVGAVVASPFLIGSQIESVLTKQDELVNQQFSRAKESSPLFKQLDFKLDSYDKGFMGATAASKVTLALNVPAKDGEAKVYEIPLISKISHGPYLGDNGFGLAHVVTKPKLDGLDVPEWITDETFTMETSMGFDRQLSQAVTMAPVNHSFDTSDGSAKVEFGGAVLSGKGPADNRAEVVGRMEIASLSVADGDGKEQFKVQPFAMDIESKGEADFSNGTYTGSSEAIKVTIAPDTGESGEVSIASMQMNGDYQQSDAIKMMLGTSSLTFNDIQVSNPSALPKPINIPKFQVTTGLKESGDKALDISMTQQAELGADLAEMMQLPVAVKSALLTLNIKSLPVSTVQKFQEIQRKAMTEAAKGAPTEAPMSEEDMTQMLQEVANSGSRLQLLVDAKAESGKLLADIDAGFRPGLNMTGSELMAIANAPTPASFLKLLVGKGDASLDKAVTDKAGLTPMLQFMLADFVALEGETFKSKLQLNDGQLLINGSPLPMLQ